MTGYTGTNLSLVTLGYRASFAQQLYAITLDRAPQHLRRPAHRHLPDRHPVILPTTGELLVTFDFGGRAGDSRRHHRVRSRAIAIDGTEVGALIFFDEGAGPCSGVIETVDTSSSPHPGIAGRGRRHHDHPEGSQSGHDLHPQRHRALRGRRSGRPAVPGHGELPHGAGRRPLRHRPGRAAGAARHRPWRHVLVLQPGQPRDAGQDPQRLRRTPTISGPTSRPAPTSRSP